MPRRGAAGGAGGAIEDWCDALADGTGLLEDDSAWRQPVAQKVSAAFRHTSQKLSQAGAKQLCARTP
jgi:hypothetical protein